MESEADLTSTRPATRIELLRWDTIPMRAFHMTWMAFFLSFFAWFGIAPLMPVVREEFGLSPAQVGNTIIASVAVTILARLLIGWLTDRIGPRISYTLLLVAGSIPVMGIGLARGYESFLLLRLAIGAIGASFVITQYHTSVMFAPRCVGTANATTAGWGNLGGGVTQIAMPLLFSAFLLLGFGEFWSWRLSMVLAGLACLAAGIAYYFFTKDTPEGNLSDLRSRGLLPRGGARGGSFIRAAKDRRVWVLFVIYGACFGVELTIHNIAALYFTDYFGFGMKAAGLAAALFGLMNIFARTLGGVLSDRFGLARGLRGRIVLLFAVLLAEGVALVAFARADAAAPAVALLLVFSLFVQMSEGATFAVVPFVSRRDLGSVAGIVGAGGNTGAMAAGFLFKGALEWPAALFVLGTAVSAISFLALTVRFSPATELGFLREVVRARRGRRAVAARAAAPAVAATGDLL